MTQCMLALATGDGVQGEIRLGDIVAALLAASEGNDGITTRIVIITSTVIHHGAEFVVVAIAIGIGLIVVRLLSLAVVHVKC